MRHRRGFALMATVWLMVAITAVSLEVSWLARSRRLATANVLEGEQARVAALSGLDHAHARLAGAIASSGNDALADPWRWIADSVSASLGAARYTFRMVDAAASLDVNDATEDMLARLFVGCGASSAEASAAADRIADWRDPDQLRRMHGAERDDYLAAGSRQLPRDAAVLSVAELDDLLDMPVVPWACARALLSVGARTQVNPNTAPVPVLQALPGMDATAARAIVAARGSGRRLHDFREFVGAAPAAYRSTLEAHAEQLQRLLVFQTSLVRVTSTATVDGSPVRVVAESLMRRAGATVFVEWQVIR